MGGLTAAEIAQWNEQGYCICRGALLPEDLAPMVADYEQIGRDLCVAIAEFFGADDDEEQKERVRSLCLSSLSLPVPRPPHLKCLSPTLNALAPP